MFFLSSNGFRGENLGVYLTNATEVPAGATKLSLSLKKQMVRGGLVFAFFVVLVPFNQIWCRIFLAVSKVFLGFL